MLANHATKHRKVTSAGPSVDAATGAEQERSPIRGTGRATPGAEVVAEFVSSTRGSEPNSLASSNDATPNGMELHWWGLAFVERITELAYRDWRIERGVQYSRNGMVGALLGWL